MRVSKAHLTKRGERLCLFGACLLAMIALAACTGPVTRSGGPGLEPPYGRAVAEAHQSAPWRPIRVKIVPQGIGFDVYQPARGLAAARDRGLPDLDPNAWGDGRTSASAHAAGSPTARRGP